MKQSGGSQGQSVWQVETIEESEVQRTDHAFT